MAYNVRDSHLVGCQLSCSADLATIFVGQGVFYLPDTGRAIIPSIISVAAPITPSTWFHVYLYANGGVGAVELSTVEPSAIYQGTARTKSTDTTRRYAGSIFISSAGTLIPFRHYVFGMQGNIIEYTPPAALSTSVMTLLSGVVSQAPVTVSAASVAPSTVARMFCEVTNTATLVAYFNNSVNGTVSATNYLRKSYNSSAAIIDIALDGSRAFTYVYGAGITLGGSLTLRTLGYYFDR